MGLFGFVGCAACWLVLVIVCVVFCDLVGLVVLCSCAIVCGCLMWFGVRWGICAVLLAG